MGVIFHTDAGGATNAPSPISVVAPSLTWPDTADHKVFGSGDLVAVVIASTYAGADVGYKFSASSGANSLTRLKEWFTDGGPPANNYAFFVGSYGGNISVSWPGTPSGSYLQTYNIWVAWIGSSGDNTNLSVYDTQYGTGSAVTSLTVPTLAAASYDGSGSVLLVAGGQGMTSAAKLKYGHTELAGGTTTETRCWERFFTNTRAGDTWPGGESLALNASTSYRCAHIGVEDQDASADEAVWPIVFPTGDTPPAAASTTFGGGISIL